MRRGVLIVLIVGALGVSTADAAKPRPGAATAGAEMGEMAPLPPVQPDDGGTPSEGPVCPDCENGGFIQVKAVAGKVTELVMPNSLRTAKSGLARFGLNQVGEARLVIFSAKSQAEVLADVPLGGYSAGIWTASSGQAFGATSIPASRLPTTALDATRWGYNRTTGAGFIAVIRVFAPGSASQSVRLPIAIKRADGTVATPP